jgi:hypothetical protein
VALGVAFIGVGSAISGALAIIAAVTAAATFLVTPLGLVLAGTAALAAGFVYLTGIGDTLGATMRGVADALSTGDLGLAWRVGLAGMEAEWTGLVETLTIAWNDFKSFFVDGWHDAVMLVRLVFVDFISWLSGQLNSVIDGFFGRLSRLNDATYGVLLGPIGGLLAEAAAQVEGGDPDKIRNNIIKDAQAAQAARDAARRQDQDAAGQMARDAAQRALNLRAGAAIAAAFRGRGGGAGAGGAGNEVASLISGAAKGAFAGFGSLQTIFGGGGGPTKEITKRLDKVVEKTDEEIKVMEEVARQLARVDGQIWGF